MPSFKIQPKAIVALFILTVLTFSCDLTEPERFYNEEPEKIQQGAINFFDLDETKHYAGHLKIKFKVDDLSFNTAAVNVFLDQKLIWTLNSSADTTEFQIYTPGYSEGLHTLRVHVVSKGMGYFTLLNIPSLEFTKQLYFDQSIPESVTLTGYDWDGMHPKIRWTKSNSLNFDHYIIEKSSYGVFHPVNKIYNKDSTSYVIRDIYKACSADFGTYRVSVSNSVESSPSSSINIKYGKKLPFVIHEYGSPNSVCGIPEKNIIINLRLDSTKLNIMSYNGGALIHSVSASNVGVIPNNFTDNHLLLGNKTRTFSSLDLDNYAISPITSIPKLNFSYSAFVEGKTDRLIFVGEYLRLVNSTNGVCLDSVYTATPTYHTLCLNSDRSNLYLSYENYLYYYSLAGDSITLVKKVSISETRLSNMIYAEITNQIIAFYVSGDMLFYNSETLDLIKTYKKNLWRGFNSSISGQNIYVSFWVDHWPSLTEPSGLVVKYDLATMQELQQWYFMDQVRHIFAYEEFNILYAFCDDYTTWLIDLTEGK